MALYGTAVDYRAECPGIMVEAHTVDFHIPAVEEKSVFGVKFHCAEAESRVYGVNILLGVEIKYLALYPVQLRVADIPQSRVLYSDGLLERMRGSRCKLYQSARVGSS
jgi:hypothetical protein